ncbi:DUF4129 domain-containing protein [Flavobacterium sp. '19STA2R22 D10 B1']|uniref:DUF4129 domain-containing protein n=1 Tax=Flavobacterium aerium TaxID=3037261 RepID=UPI00278C0B80|nr:DUF4129 domain-containing protein [Flavobacterium sp. '19STA2R22 D10 B1']
MNKLLLYLFLLCAAPSWAQDSLAAVKKDTIVFTEKDIILDHSAVKLQKFEKNFQQKYTDDDFQYKPRAVEQNMWQRFVTWLKNTLSKLFSFGGDGPSGKVIEITLKVLAVIVIIFVIYLIVKAIMNKEGQWIFGRSSDKKIIRYDEIEKQIHLIDFEKLIQNSLQSGERRLSIRYYYLWLLKKMAEKEIIEWDPEKTNSDYLYEIKNEALKSEFSYLSYLYNYIWYGEFDLDEPAFEKAKIAFEKAIQTVR